MPSCSRRAITNGALSFRAEVHVPRLGCIQSPLACQHPIAQQKNMPSHMQTMMCGGSIGSLLADALARRMPDAVASAGGRPILITEMDALKILADEAVPLLNVRATHTAVTSVTTAVPTCVCMRAIC